MFLTNNELYSAVDLKLFPITNAQLARLSDRDESQLQSLAKLLTDMMTGQNEDFQLTEPSVIIPIELIENFHSAFNGLKEMHLVLKMWLGRNSQLQVLSDWMNKVFHSEHVTVTAAAAITIDGPSKVPSVILRIYISVTDTALSDSDKMWYAEARHRHHARNTKRA